MNDTTRRSIGWGRAIDERAYKDRRLYKDTHKANTYKPQTKHIELEAVNRSVYTIEVIKRAVLTQRMVTRHPRKDVMSSPLPPSPPPLPQQ